MKVFRRVALLAILLVSAFAVLVLVSSEERVFGTRSDVTVTDWPLFLNGEAVGSTRNSRPLKARLESLEKKLDMNVNASAAMPTIGNVALAPDPRLSMADLGQIWDLIEDHFIYPAFKRVFISRGEPCSASSGSNKAAFVLSNEKLSTDHVDKLRNGGSCLQSISMIVYGPRQGMNGASIKSHRVGNSGIEIDATGAYFINERVGTENTRVRAVANLAHPTLRQRLAAATVKQRPIDLASLEKEFGALIERRTKEGSRDFLYGDEGTVVPIIVDGKTSYTSFATLLSLAGGRDVKLMIIVNNTGMP